MKGIWSIGIVVALLLFFVSQKTPTIVVQDSPIKFGSTRKHPFDVFSDPYHPPERENPYIVGGYQQIGVLKDDEKILPLFGRPMPLNSSKWQYYTMKDKLKLPVSLNGRPCGERGCDELQDRGQLVVTGVGTLDSYMYDTKQLVY